MRRPSAAGAATFALLAGIVAAGLALRLWHVDHELPFVYYVDERSHFASVAVDMLQRATLDPGYLQNPSGFTYLVYAAVGLVLDHGPAVRRFASDPSPVFVVARTVAALLGVAGSVAAFALGRALGGVRAGVVAAAISAFAFLPVAFSRLALTDVGTLAPVALSVLGSVWALERGGRADFMLAGTAAGLAIGFKYTAGLVLLPLVAAAVIRLARARAEGAGAAGAARDLARLALGLVGAGVAFFLTTPFFFLAGGRALAQLAAQAGAAGSPKLGQGGELPVLAYLRSLTWGLGWLPLAAALAGAALEARRRPARAAVLVAFPFALLAYLSVQERFFGRWLIPAYPVLAALAALGVVRASAAATVWLGRVRGSGTATGQLRRARLAPARGVGLESALLAVLCALVLAQPVAADWRSARLLGRTDTRTLARTWLERHYPPDLRIAVEPEVPPLYYRTGGGSILLRRDLERAARAHGLDYSRSLSPVTVDGLRASGTCLVMTLGYVRGRVERDRAEPALHFYRRLERESTPVFVASPARAGARPPPFDFDLSYNGYPPQLVRPGPEVRVLRLDRCRQGFGPLSPSERAALGRAA